MTDNISAMATLADKQFVLDAVGPLCAPLHEGLERARSIAEGHFIEHDLSEKEDACGVTHLTRFHLRGLLRKKELGNWTLVGNRLNGQVLLRSDMLRMRLLHEWPKDGIPAPGSNEARIDYYRNPDVGLYGVQASQLIAVWAITEDGKIDIRIVRTLGKWKTGQPAKADIDFPLPKTWDELSDLTFTPSAGNINVTLPFEDDEEEGDANSTRG